MDDRQRVQENYNCHSLQTILVDNNSVPSKTITIVHFNDVYNIESQTQEPVGGAARFVTAVSQLASSNPLVLFSGDAFNPSISRLYFSCT